MRDYEKRKAIDAILKDYHLELRKRLPDNPTKQVMEDHKIACLSATRFARKLKVFFY